MSELSDKIGTTFTVEGFTVTLSVESDDASGTADDEGLTARQIAAYRAGDWEYVGLVGTASREGVELGNGSLWGIERGYLPMTDEHDRLTVEPVEYLDVYDDAVDIVIDECVSDARATLTRLCAGVLDVSPGT